MKKKFLSLLLLITIVAGLFPTTMTAYAATSGKCGTNLTWSLADDGTLTISGSVKMTDYTPNSPSPFDSISEDIKKIVIGDKITSIGDYAFYQTRATNVELPDSIVSIGEMAFYRAFYLSELTIPKNVVNIGYEAFYGCSHLNKINWNAINISDFANNDRVFGGVGDIGGCKIVFGDDVISIPKYAFYEPSHSFGSPYVPEITGLTFGNNLQNIGAYAFCGTIDIDKTYYGSYMDITIPNSVSNIGNGAFADCKGIRKVTLPDSITSINKSVFSNCSGLTEITVPKKVMSVADYAFSGCNNLTSVHYKGTDSEWPSISIGSDNTSLTDATIYYTYENFEYSINDTVATITDCDTSVKGEIVIPDTINKHPVNGIGSWAFSNCTSLTGMRIPDSIISIGKNAFSACYRLKNIYFNGSSEMWGNISIGDGNQYLIDAQINYFWYLNIYDTEKKLIKSAMIDDGALIDVSDIKQINGYSIKLYTDESCTNEFEYATKAVNKNLNLYLEYSVNQYTNKFVNDDGTVIQESTVDYGTTISAPDIIPSKPADDQYTYTFAGWDGFSEGMTQQAEEMIFTAKYTTTTNQYSYHFVDDDGTILKEATIDYGARIVPPENPIKDRTPQYSYEFTGWEGYTDGMTQGAEELYFYATYSVSINKYTYKFVDEDGTVLKEQTVNYDTIITAPSNPEKPSTAQYTYIFEKWNGYTPNMRLTEDMVFTAEYSAKVNQYTYKFVDDDGNVIDEKTVDYGTEIFAPGVVLTKAATDQYTYTHTGWKGYVSGMIISENIIFTPTFAATTNQYDYKFVDDDGTVLKEATVDYGSEIIAPEAPSKEGTQKYTYVFAYWDGFSEGIKQKAESMIFKAVYNSVINKYTYKFIDEDGKELKSKTVDYGTEIVPPETPSKSSTDKYSYFFKGWKGYEDGMIITDDISFTAEYSAEINRYTYKFVDYDGTIVKEGTISYGTIIPLPATPGEHYDQQYTYMFSSWSGYVKGMTITKDVTFTAKYSKVLNQYSYLFVDENGETIFEGYADYGTTINAPEAPQKASTDKYSYTFAGWKGYTKGMILTGDIVFTATYTSVINKYTYKFVDDDGTVIVENIVDYDTVITTPNDPTKESTKQYTYKFVGWDGYEDGIKQKAETMIFKAKYHTIVNQYTYTFINEDGTVIDKRTADYGSKITLPEKPYKNPTKQYSYVFAGWEGYTDGMNVTDDVTFTARYTQIINQYTYRFVDDDIVIMEKTVDYGTKIILPDTPADKDPYTFDYWNGYTTEMTVTDDITFTAIYKYKKYTVSIYESDKTIDVTYGERYSIPVQELRDFIFNGYYTKPSGSGEKLTDEQGNSIDVYSFKQNIIAYPYYIHSFANKVIINGVDTVRPGDRNVIQTVQFATDRQANNLMCTVRYPKDFNLVDVIEKDFSLANINKTETVGEYTYSYLTCIYDYSGLDMPTNQTVTPFELKFDIGKGISQGDVSVEIFDMVLMGESNYNINIPAIKDIKVLPKMTEKIEIVGSDKIDKPTKYIALVTPDYTTNKDVSWSVNDETIAKIDEDGTLTPIMNGAVIITAFAKDGSEVFATYEVDVIAYAKVDSIRLAGEWDKEFSPDTYEYNIYVNKDVDSLTLTTEYKNGTLFLDDVLLLSNTEHKVELINTTTVITLKRGNVSQLTNSEYRINIIKFEGTKTTVSEDKKYFTVKPVNMTAEKGGVVILALYRNGKCIEMQNKAYTDENLDSDGNISFTATTDYTGAKVMVWENLISMKPVCPAETVK